MGTEVYNTVQCICFKELHIVCIELPTNCKFNYIGKNHKGLKNRLLATVL